MKAYHPYSMYLCIGRTGAKVLSRDFNLKHAITEERIYFQLVYDYPSARLHPFPRPFFPRRIRSRLFADWNWFLRNDTFE